MVFAESSPVDPLPLTNSAEALTDRSGLGSFRDPGGRVFLDGVGPVQRRLTNAGIEMAQHISTLPSVRHFQEEGSFVLAAPSPEDPRRLLHPRVFFPSYPHEWSAAALAEAGRHTLTINESLLGDGWELKDATPTNVLFEGSRPIFVDFLSPAPRGERQVGWGAYGQFCRTFLIPLMLHQRGIPLRWMYLAHRDGIPPSQALPLLPFYARWSPTALSLVTFPAWLERNGKGEVTTTSPAQGASPEVLGTINRRLLKGLRRHLERLAVAAAPPSVWRNYQDLGISYSSEGLESKERFVAEALDRHRPRSLLDLGCNTGKFSLMAARRGSRVVALDADPACVDRLYREARAEGLDILPLLADLGRPTPRSGWNGQEELSLQERLQGRFEMTLALAIVHHLLVRERVPLEAIVHFLANTTNQFLLVEWVDPADPQFQRLSGPHHHLYRDISLEQFKQELGHRFSVLKELEVAGSKRNLLLLEARG